MLCSLSLDDAHVVVLNMQSDQRAHEKVASMMQAAMRRT